MYLAEWIIDISEHRKNEWKLDSHGNALCKTNHNLEIHQEHHDKYGKTRLNDEIRILVDQGLVRVKKWEVYDTDAAVISYCVEDLPRFYQIQKEEWKKCGKQFVSKQERVNAYKREIEQTLSSVHKKWIGDYYEDLLKKLNQIDGKDFPKSFEKLELYTKCFRGLDELDTPMLRRTFSKKYLGNSKQFENEAQPHIISAAKNLCPEVEKDMDDGTVLEQLLIKTYSQEMTLKGALNIRIKGSKDFKEMDLGMFPYGIVLNAETLQHVEIMEDQPQIERIVTIENKANFETQPYEEGTLYVFSHGYFSPYEREFLIELKQKLEKSGRKAAYFHSGDLDYGGIKIFEYIQKRIFPKVQPLLMDVPTFERYIDYAEPIPKDTLKKLKNVNVPILQDLIQKILETGKGIEQESFLF